MASLLNPVIIEHCLKDVLHPVEHHFLALTCREISGYPECYKVTRDDIKEYALEQDNVTIIKEFNITISYKDAARHGAYNCLVYLKEGTKSYYQMI
jgi:hypothetical protein